MIIIMMKYDIESCAMKVSIPYLTEMKECMCCVTLRGKKSMEEFRYRICIRCDEARKVEMFGHVVRICRRL